MSQSITRNHFDEWMMPVYAPAAFIPVRGAGSRLWDQQGKEYIDFAGGIAVLNTGHLHPQIVAAVEDQLKKLSHTCFQVLAYEPYLALCEKMNQKVPGDFAKKTLLVTTGSEAVENAVKIARAATGRSGAIAFTGAYHGRTHYTLSLTGKVNPYSAGMGLMPGHVYRALYPCALHGVSDDEAIASIHRIFKNDAAPEDIAAIIIEPVQGEGGFYAASPAFMQRLRALCDEFGALLIIDEVMTGFRVALAGAQSYYGVEPDLTCLGKIIGGGMPVGAFGGRKDVMEALAPTGPVYQAGTLSGNPIAMAAGFACLTEVAQPGIHETLTDRTTQLANGLLEAAEEAGIPLVVNHVGGMFGIFFTEAKTVTRYQDVVKCDVERFKRFFHLMLEEGVYLAPSAFEAGFMSVAHSEEDINNTIDAARKVFAKL